MKIFSFLLLLVFASNSFSQDSFNHAIHLSKLAPEGVLLDKGWKFQAGDNPEWAMPGYDDRGWRSINPALELHNLPEVREAEIGWFRLKLEVDSLLASKSLAILVSTIGASEIYLNGKLIYRFGIVSANYKEEQTRFFFDRPFSLKLDQQTSHVIAIRYSFNKENLYLRFTNTRPCMRLILNTNNQAFTDYIEREGFYSTLRSIQVSFYLPLGFLLLFLYFSYRRKKEYLYIGVFCFCFFLGMLMNILALESNSVSELSFYLLADEILLLFGAFAFINGIYTLYKQKKSWFYYVMVVYGLLVIPFFFGFPDWSGVYNDCFFPLINFEFLRLHLQAVRRRRPGAWILLITSILLAVGLICFIWLSVTNQRTLSNLVSSICFVLPGVALSLFFAGEFAATRSALRLRLLEVEGLSQKTIAQEKEKQQILATQNETLDKQVTERTAELSQSLKDLKETQAQLIQREKMASLGELTAGIAHEIQNPLNFVNNFSDVNLELAEELHEELKAGHLQAAVLCAEEIIENERKISHHGKRADEIVKGMLQHSRTSTGKKEPTDINSLADEFLRLSYHGIRAKEKTFYATLQKDFDKNLEKINLIPQDIGRVLLNLYNNAFYAVSDKKKEQKDGYEPTVSVSTKKINDKIEIRVADNGNGISQKILDKIFQPFFTTKPTGQGTGLGLSLSYDIIKAHGGEIKVETKEGEGAEFIISLPVS